MTKKKKKDSSQRKVEITKGIFQVLESQPKRNFNYKQIAAALNLTSTQDKNLLLKRLGQLKAKERIKEIDKGKYTVIHSKEITLEGVIEITQTGNGFVIVEGQTEDIFIPQSKINRAFNGDKVRVKLTTKKRGKRKEGWVDKIIQRNKLVFVGVLEKQDSFAFVRPSDAKIGTDFFIPKEKIKDAKTGMKVLIKFLEWPSNVSSPYAEVIKVLGIPGEQETEIHAILADYGLPYEFPVEVENYANQLDTSITEEEIKKRWDFRNVLTFTIDPKDAKDFDDAISFEQLDNGNYRVGIHIADVSHYLQPNTLLDNEAYDRATSVYLVDRVVPMLPEVLSNHACSLRPLEDKYTFSAVFEIDKKAQIKGQWFGRTVINSNERFAYEEAQWVIETKDNHIPEHISIRNGAYQITNEVAQAISTLDDLAKMMRENRMKHGAISFDKVEVRFALDEQNNPTGVFFKTSEDANKLIEEFMLLANRKVAEFVGKKKNSVFVYRIHDQPDNDKLLGLQQIISRFGYRLDLRTRQTVSDSLNKLLEKVKGTKEQNLVDTLTIRSMAKAIYTTENIGHYGLAFDYYTHFTSPIRRYPDVMVHRLLQQYLEGNQPPKALGYEEKCKHASQMEVLATNAERDSIKYMQIKYMQAQEGKQFVGVISGVTEWGIFVELIENKCEGMVRLRDIKEDYYVYDERQYAIVGERFKEVYQLGDEVMVMVKKADLIKRHLDFALIGRHLN